MTFLSDKRDIKSDKVKTKPQIRNYWRNRRKKNNVEGRRGIRRDKNKTRRRGTQKWVNNRQKKKNDKPLVNIFSN
jgi:hypothetical protein